MFNPVGGFTRTGGWYADAMTAGRPLSTGANSFEKQLLSAISGPLERSAHRSVEVPAAESQAASQNGTAGSVECQNSVACVRTVDEQPSAPESAVADNSEPAVMGALKAALVAAGHDPDKFNLTYQEQEVFFPGGNYIYRGITATFDDGYTESYSADLTAESPKATVGSIEHTMRDLAAGVCS
ncbi:MAG: hypothetical protein ABFD86_02870 [Bryobacteraceae bacterium]